VISPYTARRRRAIELLGTALPAEELLGFLIGLMEHQAAVFDWATAREFREDAGRVRATDVPRFDPARLALPPMVPELRKFVVGVAPIATDVLSRAASIILDATDDRLLSALEQFLEGGSLADSALEIGTDEAPLTFYSRAFLQPVMETLRLSQDGPPSDAHHGADDRRTCPGCGHPPLLSIFRDGAEKQNARYLCCSLCSYEWAFPRLTCPLCGESASKALLHHTSESLPHIRIDECRSCRGYLKAIDLRKAGSAVPIIDEIAAIELDLWAGERSFQKGCTNLLGF